MNLFSTNMVCLESSFSLHFFLSFRPAIFLCFWNYFLHFYWYMKLFTINEQIWKLHNWIRGMRTVKSIKQFNVRVICTTSYRFCALFGICSFIDYLHIFLRISKERDIVILWFWIKISFNPDSLFAEIKRKAFTCH